MLEKEGKELDKQKTWLLFLFFSMLVWMAPINAFAQSDLGDREQVFSFLEDAFESQVSLSEQDRTMAEIEGVLNPYFTEDYKALFIMENVVGQENQYSTYGTDFAPYYIPFYAFSEKTKVVDMDDEIYVLEYFPGNVEGPTTYESHYEGLRLVKEQNKWKVADYLYDEIPEEVIEKAYPENIEKEKVTTATPKTNNLFPQTLVFGPNFASLKTDRKSVV